jgi:putative copper export protein
VEWIIARWVTFVATVLAGGACVLALTVIPRSPADEPTRIAAARDSARVGLAATLALIPAGLMRLADQLFALRSPGDPFLAGFMPLMTATTWGTGFVWQAAATLVALSGFALALAAPASRARWLLAALGAVGLCATPSVQGHAIGSEVYTNLAVAADIAHVTGAGLWLGAIGVIGLLGVAIPNGDGLVTPTRAARADARLRLLVPLVPPVALPGAVLLLLSGVIATVLKLTDVRDLWVENWGRYVLVKTVLVLIVVALGAVNWRRLGPRLALVDGVPALRQSLIIELLLALLVLLITAVLVVTPLPGEC